MAPQQHLAWFTENVEWFRALPEDQLETPVPNCPGWAVVDVLNHLASGLGLAYPVAMATAPGTPTELVFSAVAWPTTAASGRAAIEQFSANLDGCIRAFEVADPNASCWTYAGSGVAAFWFRRAAIETALHRIDVEEALATTTSMSAERTRDAIVETLEFALPFAITSTAAPSGSLRVESDELDLRFDLEVGPASPEANISGPGDVLLRALWGRQPADSDRAGFVIEGDAAVADEWLTLIERAFAGR